MSMQPKQKVRPLTAVRFGVLLVGAAVSAAPSHLDADAITRPRNGHVEDESSRRTLDTAAPAEGTSRGLFDRATQCHPTHEDDRRPRSDGDGPPTAGGARGDERPRRLSPSISLSSSCTTKYKCTFRDTFAMRPIVPTAPRATSSYGRTCRARRTPAARAVLSCWGGRPVWAEEIAPKEEVAALLTVCKCTQTSHKQVHLV